MRGEELDDLLAASNGLNPGHLLADYLLPAAATDLRNNIVVASVVDPDPDPHVFWPPGSGSTSQMYGSGSGSGSFYYHAKIVRKILIPTFL
jgi:hypothetical protein